MVIDGENQSESTKKPAVLGDHGELWIKLKLPKDEEQDCLEEDQNRLRWENHQQSTGNNTGRICHVCDKPFRSGKALGGHMRIHFQAHKELIFNKKLNSSQPIKIKKRKREEVTLADIAKKINISKSYPPANGTPAVPTCSICSKIFPSMKSLFGHMRCHPDRDWRGIQPPRAVKTSSSSLVSDVEPKDSGDQVNSAAPQQGSVDLTKSLLGWSATAKRGRKNTILDREFLDAAHELMRLARGGSFESSPTNEQRIEEPEGTNSNSLTCKTQSEDKKGVPEWKKRSFQEFSAGYLKEHPVKQLSFPNDRKFEGLQSNGMTDVDNKVADETGFLAGKSVNSEWEDASNWPKEYEGEDFTDDESASKNTEQLNHKTCKSSNGKLIMLKKKKKRKKIKDLDSVHDASPGHQVMTATPDKYRCSTCDKSFPTHQALGGHRSSHNKIRVTIQNSFDGWTSAADEDEDLADSLMLEDEEIKESEGAASSKQVDDNFQCHICSTNFSTAQALGGHKKCHSAGATDAPSSQVTSLGELSHTCDGRVLEFDLNEAPPVEDDAGFQSEHVAAGFGHASSSFNSVEFPVFESSSSEL